MVNANMESHAHHVTIRYYKIGGNLSPGVAITLSTHTWSHDYHVTVTYRCIHNSQMVWVSGTQESEGKTLGCTSV